jgi:hypothetical protein
MSGLSVDAAGLPWLVAIGAREFMVAGAGTPFIAAPRAHHHVHGDLAAVLDAAMAATLAGAQGFERLFLLIS